MNKKKSSYKFVEIDIDGIVQGVGFRPFVYRTAHELKITGSVCNDGNGVTIEAYAKEEVLHKFIKRLQYEKPPLAVIDNLRTNFSKSQKRVTGSFIIKQTVENTKGGGGLVNAKIPADIALCPACASEIVDSTNRRYGYPFTNCTDCGPRYTIVREVPYDRPKTTMSFFPMCNICQEEYHSPLNRRFHAQPNACPMCGPQIELVDLEGKMTGGDATKNEEQTQCITRLAEELSVGNIAAICGLGGYHLAVDATNTNAVTRLRKYKSREHKPFAVMCKEEHLSTIANFCEEELALLQSPQAPIVLLDKKEGPLAENIAPNINRLGVMLPYTPLHYLLLNSEWCPPFLVMTSGNHYGNPICRTKEEAERELRDIADIFLHHNRPILTRVDDSVLRFCNISNKKGGPKNTPFFIRRSRGYVPNAILVGSKELPSLLACGGAMKNSFCLSSRGPKEIKNSFILSQHIGELENPANFDFYLESIGHLQKLYNIAPEIVICDTHPNYPSTRYAEGIAKKHDLPLYRVQHHFAHAAAVMAEHQLDEAIAIVLDGTGLGDDGTIWGGELLRVSLSCGPSYERLSHLSPLPMVGGDLAAVEPWRMGLALLANLENLTETEKDILSQQIKGIRGGKIEMVDQLLKRNFSYPLTSSAGRLFDAISSLLGVCHTMSYEGQAAMELEAVAEREFLDSSSNSREKWRESLRLPKECGEKKEICVQNFVKMLAAERNLYENRSRFALFFHKWLAEEFAGAAVAAAKKYAIKDIVLAGGCMQNGLLSEALSSLLTKAELSPYINHSLPMNDGGIAFGQAIIGGLHYVSGNSYESGGGTRQS